MGESMLRENAGFNIDRAQIWLTKMKKSDFSHIIESPAHIPLTGYFVNNNANSDH